MNKLAKRMNKLEARQILSTWLVSSKGTEEQLGYIEGWFDKEDEEAFLMAIEALNEQRKGKWIEVGKSEHGGLSIVSMRCNQCGRYAYLVLPKGTKCVYDYCPWCKSDMIGDKND